ncbi:hypothetical protein NDN08_003256 [Rhodosorus marinus]|uniref:Diphosphomevalonate decarboxylase n=1 Tax=Rhodosorus marinus TaxID=101924 RepID=A0AAV8UVZ5_9RHOD|nr:hypothetical protein NDN08_003256 [Rhodosorus marinus]
MERRMVTCTAPVNIALIKYWGKLDEDLIIPLNSSLSITLHQESLRTTTTVAWYEHDSSIRMWLNGEELDVDANLRIRFVLDELRSRSRPEFRNLGFRIASVNNFPTAAGLASSAAGLACLVYTVAELIQYKETFPGELSSIARRGSGSACRSLDSGFVKWNKGSLVDGSDSVAEQIVDDMYWPEVRILVCVVSDQKKTTSSTKGMRNSVESSELLKYRALSIVDDHITAMEEAIKRMDFNTMARLTMKDSNQFHAVCLDTEPPIFYLNETSKAIISAVEEFNAYSNQEDINELSNLMLRCFPPRLSAAEVDSSSPSIIGRDEPSKPLSAAGEHVLGKVGTRENSVQYFIKTRAGPGPLRMSDTSHLLDSESLEPKT